MSSPRTTLPLLLFALASGDAAAQTCGAQRLEPAALPWSGYALLGASSDLDGHRLVLGAPYASATETLAGGVQLYERVPGGWVEEATLLSPDPQPQQRFGHAVAIQDEELFVAEVRPGAAQRGRVHVYDRSGGAWQLVQTLEPTDLAPEDAGNGFGESLAVLGDVLVIGAPADEEGGVRTGSVYTYVRRAGAWSFEGETHPPMAPGAVRFGTSLALTPERLLVGAPDASLPGDIAVGSGYVFRRKDAPTGWAFRQLVHAAEPVPGEHLGSKVAMEDTVIALGAFESTGLTGRVLVFEAGGGAWNEMASLAPVGATSFGFDVALEGGRAFASTLEAVYEFQAASAGWIQTRRIAPPSSAMGWSFDVDEATLVAGAATEDGFAGAAYVVNLGSPDCDESGWPDACEIEAGLLADADTDGVPDECAAAVGFAYCFGDGSAVPCPCGNEVAPGTAAGCANSTGAGARLTATGVASLADDSLVLQGEGLPQSVALYYQGTLEAVASPFGDGLGCVGGERQRLGNAFAFDGTTSWPTAGSARVSEAGEVLVPGTRRYQIWYRNPEVFCTPATFNLSNALRVEWVP